MQNVLYSERPVRKEEAAVCLGRSVRSLERAMAARQIRYFKAGKSVTFLLSDIENYRAKCAVKARP
jgi:hypothetical protein